MLYSKIILEIFSLRIEPKKLLKHITFIIFIGLSLMFFESGPKSTKKTALAI